MGAVVCLVAVSACTDDADENSEGTSTGETSGTSDASSTAASTASSTGGEVTSGAATSSADADGSSSGDDTGPSPGCGVDPGFDEPAMGSMEVDGVERAFLLSVPDGYDPDQTYPLVFAFHGRGGTSELFRAYAGVEDAAAGDAVFVYPQGLPLPEMGNQTGWDLDLAGSDVDFIELLLADLSENLCIDPERVFATGHSFGGYFSNTLGCALGDRFRAIAPVAGGGPFGSCTGQVAALVIHGLDDPTVPTSAGEMSRDHWLSQNGCSERTAPADPSECVAYQGCEAGFAVEWCLHEEEGQGIGTHTWPSFGGPAIWAFFAGY